MKVITAAALVMKVPSAPCAATRLPWESRDPTDIPEWNDFCEIAREDLHLPERKPYDATDEHRATRRGPRRRPRQGLPRGLRRGL